jgi:hypothetical protein
MTLLTPATLSLVVLGREELTDLVPPPAPIMASPTTALPLNALVLTSLVQQGNLPALATIRDIAPGMWLDCSQSPLFCEAAAQWNQRETLVWLKEQGFNCETASQGAVKAGSLSMLQLVEELAPDTVDEVTLIQAIDGDHPVIVGWLTEERGVELSYDLVMDVALEGKLPLLQRCYRYGGPEFIDEHHESLLLAAAQGGDIPTVEWLLTTQPEGEYEEMWEYAAIGGKVPLLEWARNQGYDFPSPHIMDKAGGEGGHPSVVEWYLTWREVSWDSVGEGAIEGNQVEMLRWARERGYQYRNKSILMALMHLSKHSLLHLVAEGCPYNKAELHSLISLTHNNEMVLRWLDKYLP